MTSKQDAPNPAPKRTIAISRGGTLKPANERKPVYDCAEHGNYVRRVNLDGCPDCGSLGRFLGYSADSITTEPVDDTMRAARGGAR